MKQKALDYPMKDLLMHMDMLEVFPAYRRRGLAFLLESDMMRRRQVLSRVPFA